MTNRLKVFTWHVHGNYLYYLTQADVDFYLPYKLERPHGYGGRADSFPWGDNVYEIPAEEVKDYTFDCILFQSKPHYLIDQYEILSETQQQLPRIFLEHDPPREHPTDTKHVVNDPSMLLVHVTHFNDLMWDNGLTPTTVIEHGVLVPNDVAYTGEIERGIVVVNNLKDRGRRLGADVFQQIRKEVPIDLVGMNSEELGGIGEVDPDQLPAFIAKYRFFFNPIRYTSLGLAVLEAMHIGMPIVGLRTTEMASTIDHGFSGFTETNCKALIPYMRVLLENKDEAMRIGKNARDCARQRFGIERFAGQWKNTLENFVTTQKSHHIVSPARPRHHERSTP